ncbi:8-amino-7-oxononanoate synthase [Desulfurivibrio alkaliphilus]|uniref:8-amino-7-ketopelargonate synthase n=1 Tax=Desulfurivibrio alkaliphilus (strain DSM 19089 / UNIQEM U267 / AHT2) TaxID=589865 RepID=D6Z3V4_DESAT|nr:8-amino-7-oxononanoate synthase [Desulfurivibrio alkaliphilus]ADH86229.1 8-amino-7-oxononanoate synthase [Desulfurivibrio alkaliphilus AHT 2]
MVDIAAYLKRQQKEGRLRQLPGLLHPDGGRVRLEAVAHDLLDFSSNDYLGLTRHPLLLVAAAEALSRYGTGAGAARLMSGDFELHRELELALARLKEQEAALLFGSGYLANIGLIPALVGRHDVIFSDKLNHASIQDGCRLAGARLHRFAHNDCNHLEDLLKRHRGAKEALIVVESLYSMDGDICPLADVVTLKERYGCLLLVDEAHATGLFGDNGAGLLAAEGLAHRVDLVMGTLGKALGSYGAYVAGEQRLISFLLNRARSFIFSTALPPASAAAALAAVELLAAEPQLRQDLWHRVEIFKSGLTHGGVEADLGPSQIVPLVVGENQATLALARRLQERGIYATAVRPPTVPAGQARLRFSVTNHLDIEDLSAAAAIIATELLQR